MTLASQRRTSGQSTIVQHEEKQGQIFGVNLYSIVKDQRSRQRDFKGVASDSYIGNAKTRANSRSSCFWNQRWPGEAVVADPGPDLVGLGGVEPPTSRLSGVRSNQLSYRPGIV
ncbi:uncharacterized protein METZ01_LOCUS258168 [marine metagenome]|uniref:Uncharacterized protein n=1 Tax=marine metagenome TaxID=408172 RepID=A0A382IZR8_9ZZZZ